MIPLLKTFATLALIASALLVLLPEGSLRRTAALVMGLMLTLCWARGLMVLLHLPDGGDMPDSALSPTGMTVQQFADAPAPEVTASP